MSAARTLVVGDLHGCVEELNRLLDALNPEASDTIVFLGDYIDRGPASKGVIDRLLQLGREGPRCVFLKGNHEDMFLAFIGEGGHYPDGFLFNGGEATLRSYGMEGRDSATVAAHLPSDHLEFLRALRLQSRHDAFFCVHAGLTPDRPLEEQQEEEMLWIRDEFIHSPHSFPFTVVFGHTPRRDVLLDLPYKIGLDTGLVYGNKLSCLELESKRLLQIRRGEATVVHRDLRKDFELAAARPAVVGRDRRQR